MADELQAASWRCGVVWGGVGECGVLPGAGWNWVM